MTRVQTARDRLQSRLTGVDDEGKAGMVVRDVAVEAGFTVETEWDAYEIVASEELETRYNGSSGTMARNAIKAARERVRQGDVPTTSDDAPVEIVSLQDLLDDPTAMEPPDPIVFPLGWRGRVTLLSAREKFGKSTLARGAIAALSRGRPFLGRTPQPRTCLHLPLEEHRSDVVRSLAEFDAYGPAVFLVERLGSDPFGGLEAAIMDTEAEFVVVDTLAAFCETLDLESGDAASWTKVMQQFGRLARDLDVALLLIHHGRKADGSYRDSTAIGAGADMLLALDDGDVEGVKKLQPKGRWELRPMSFRIKPETDGWPPSFQLTAGDLSVDTMCLMYIEANPGCTTNAVKDRIKVRAEEVGSALHRLNGKAIENRGSGNRSAWYVKEGRP